MTVHKGETWTCTFNNSVNTGTIKVIKEVDGKQVWRLDGERDFSAARRGDPPGSG